METCPASAPFFGFMGVTSALVFANIGAAYGTAKSGVGISSMGVMNPGLVMRNIIPVVMAGVLGIYGLIVAVIISGMIEKPQDGLSRYSLYTGFAHLAAGLCCGLSGLAAGMCIGIVGDAGVRAVGQQEKLFVGGRRPQTRAQAQNVHFQAKQQIPGLPGPTEPPGQKDEQRNGRRPKGQYCPESQRE